jgi:aryl-alcohol dehydrogenase-like predicted oxidoreductase
VEMRLLGRSGLEVSRFSFGTMTFGGEGLFQHIGNTEVEEAKRLIDVCLENGVNLFDTADIYSMGRSEEVLGEALGARRGHVLVATKAFARLDPGPNNTGLSRHHLLQACEASLRRLNTDYIDLYQVHNNDALTPIEETLRALDDLVRSGKVRYIGCSNYGGWQLMKALATSQRLGLERYISQQIYYSLLARESENELLPLGLEEGVGVLVWSPLSFGLLSGKHRRNAPAPELTRLGKIDDPGTVDMERVYSIVNALDRVAAQTGKSVPQCALNWLLRRPGVTSVIVGARNEAQLRDNLSAASWTMSDEHVNMLQQASVLPEIYPYWHQHKYGGERNPRIFD